MVYETTDCAELSTTTALCKQNVFPFCIKYLIESNDFFFVLAPTLDKKNCGHFYFSAVFHYELRSLIMRIKWT